MTGLQVWLHPSSRTKSVVSLWSLVARRLGCCKRPRANEQRRFLHSSSLRRTAAVVRDRRDVANRAHFNAGRGQRTDGRLAAGTGTADAHIHAADTMIAGHVRSIRRGLLGGEGRALARSTEA